VISDRRLSTLLVRAGRLNQEQYQAARQHQSSAGGTLAAALESTGIYEPDELLGIVAEQCGQCVINLKGCQPSKEVLEIAPEEFCRANRVLPVAALGDTLTVAVEDPFDLDVLDELRRLADKKIVPVLARDGQIAAAVDRCFGKEEGLLADVTELVKQEFSAEGAGAQVVEVDDDVTEESAPIIRMASQIIEDAHRRGASDVHVEPHPDHTLVRIRVDGVLEPVMRLPKAASRALVSRLKIMASLNITERRLPQDGRIAFGRFSRRETDIELRVSTIPVTNGEKVVMRLIDKAGALVGLDALGFSAENLSAYHKHILQPYGMILHVGPTGSGKTTTLYAALSDINRPDVNIVTAEDPVEYVLEGISQSQVNAEIGYSFARALRSFLRQDPDVILVGEIRDVETASIAVQASLTGHLLFSTLHTNDAAGTVTRLVEMGVQPFLVSSSLLVVCAQRLMRRLCKCAEKRPITESEAEMLSVLGEKGKVTELGHPKGCEACGGLGYRGRIGVHELMSVGPELQELINRSASEGEIRRVAQEAGMTPLHEDAFAKVAEGVSSIDEALSVVRVT